MLKKRPKSYTSPPLDQNPAPNLSKTEEDHKPTSKSPSLKGVFTFCLIFRVVNSLLIQTYFNPDEHWQALEVARFQIWSSDVGMVGGDSKLLASDGVCCALQSTCILGS